MMNVFFVEGKRTLPFSTGRFVDVIRYIGILAGLIYIFLYLWVQVTPYMPDNILRIYTYTVIGITPFLAIVYIMMLHFDKVDKRMVLGNCFKQTREYTRAVGEPRVVGSGTHSLYDENGSLITKKSKSEYVVWRYLYQTRTKLAELPINHFYTFATTYIDETFVKDSVDMIVLDNFGPNNMTGRFIVYTNEDNKQRYLKISNHE